MAPAKVFIFIFSYILDTRLNNPKAEGSNDLLRPNLLFCNGSLQFTFAIAIVIAGVLFKGAVKNIFDAEKTIHPCTALDSHSAYALSFSTPFGVSSALSASAFTLETFFHASKVCSLSAYRFLSADLYASAKFD